MSRSLTVSRTTLLYAAYWSLLAMFVLAFVVKAGAAPRWFIGAMIIGVTFFLYESKSIYALCTLPGPLMLGVIARVRLGVASLQFGDVHLFAVMLMFLSTTGANRSVFVGRRGLMPLVIALITLSWLLSVDFAASTVTMFGLLELFLIYTLTLNLVRNGEDCVKLLRSWCATITLCSVLVIVSYVRAEPLILDYDPAYAGLITGFEELKTTSTSFLRASFFITTFNYPLVCTLVMLTVMLLTERATNLTRLLMFGALLINVATTILMGNRSVMAGAAFSVVVAIAYLSRYKRTWWALAGSVAASFVVVQVASFFIERVIEPRQLILFLERINSGDALVERMKTWSRVGAAVLASPHALLLGLGPDASTRAREDVFAPILGTEHGVDSAYFFVLLNYGIVILIFYLRYFVMAFRLLIPKMAGYQRTIVVSIVGSMVAWLIVGIGQQFGASKAMAIGAQFAAIIELIRLRRFAPEALPAKASDASKAAHRFALPGVSGVTLP